jgi:simple sugar transport system permease protein
MSNIKSSLYLRLEPIVLPLVNLGIALIISSLIICLIGESPKKAIEIIWKGSFGSGEGLGYTLFYSTNYIFTGLAVAIAYHASLFNIGCEGQAYVGGLGVSLVGLYLGGLPVWCVIVLGIFAGALFGTAWAAIPAYLQARKGSHIVITTIMFNFIGSALMTWFLVSVLIKPGQQAPESRAFSTHAFLPSLKGFFALLGINTGESPGNLALVIALIIAALIWILLWKTRFGYELRVSGTSQSAARYAGISPESYMFKAMLISGALAGCLGLNELMGSQHRLTLDFPAGAGFIGIAVALMGRNNPVGICFSALLFGALVQGGGELAFEMPHVSHSLVIVIQGLVILFCGALEQLLKKPLRKVFLTHV